MQKPTSSSKPQKQKKFPKTTLTQSNKSSTNKNPKNLNQSKNKSKDSIGVNNVSSEAPKGCLRFLLSHSSSPFNCKIKTPKSAPIIPNKKPISNYGNPICNGSVQFGDNEQNLTPSKLLIEDKIQNSNSAESASGGDVKTPPVQASVSPEIQFGLNNVSAVNSTNTSMITPCYAAGHVVSGVTDRRKCRARGILSVGQPKGLASSDSDNDSMNVTGSVFVEDSAVSALPLPADASMHWLLSPCREEDEVLKEKLEDGDGSCVSKRLELREGQDFTESPSFSDGECLSYLGSDTTRRKRSWLLQSPEEIEKCGGFGTESSLFSAESLPSGNIIQTPQSDSSCEGKTSMPCLIMEGYEDNDSFDVNILSAAQQFDMINLSPKSYPSVWDLPPSSSFQFDCSTTASNSVDLSNFQKILDNRASWLSDSTFENVSQSQMRISWREGLASRIFEMDEFDCCRCLSDEDNNVETDDLDMKSHCCPSDDVVKAQTSAPTSVSTDFVYGKREINEKADAEITSRRSCQCAESISTDGGGPACSQDSDWTLCYKNKLFQPSSDKAGPFLGINEAELRSRDLKLEASR